MTKQISIDDLPLSPEQKVQVLEWLASKAKEIVDKGTGSLFKPGSPITIQGNTITSKYLCFDDYHGDASRQDKYDFKDLKDAEDIIVKAFADELRADISNGCHNCRYPDGN